MSSLRPAQWCGGSVTEREPVRARHFTQPCAWSYASLNARTTSEMTSVRVIRATYVPVSVTATYSSSDRSAFLNQLPARTARGPSPRSEFFRPSATTCPKPRIAPDTSNLLRLEAEVHDADHGVAGLESSARRERGPHRTPRVSLEDEPDERGARKAQPGGPQPLEESCQALAEHRDTAVDRVDECLLHQLPVALPSLVLRTQM